MQEGETSLLMAEWSIDFMRQSQEKNKPFFITLWFHSPHKPYGTLQKFIDPYLEMGETAARGATYFGQLTAVDQAVGNIRQALREMNLAENTLVWYCRTMAVNMQNR